MKVQVLNACTQVQVVSTLYHEYMVAYESLKYLVRVQQIQIYVQIDPTLT